MSTPGPQEDWQDRFDAIVAHGWDEEPHPDGATSQPAAAPPPSEPNGVNPPPPRWRGTEQDLVAAIEQADASDDEGWQPPPPRELPPVESVGFWRPLLGLTVGPGILLGLVIARPSAPGWLPWLGVALTVAGFVVLVARRGPQRDANDDGAVL